MKIGYLFSRSSSIILLICPSVITLIFIVTAIVELFELGKSKTRVKKIAKAIPVSNKLSLKGYVDKCDHHQKLAVQIRRFYLVYLYILLGGLAAVLLSTFVTTLEPIANFIGFVKFLTMDIPFVIFSMINTKHDKKHGGVKWRWDVEKR